MTHGESIFEVKVAESRVEIKRSAAKELEDVEPHLGKRILSSIEALALDPKPTQCRKLSGSENS